MSSGNKVAIPKPIPLKGYLAEDGRTQIWLCDQLSVSLNRNVGDDYFSRVLNGRRNAPPEWVLPVAEILGINVDEARELLGMAEAHAGA
jgi:hypothetical protein